MAYILVTAWRDAFQRCNEFRCRFRCAPSKNLDSLRPAFNSSSVVTRKSCTDCRTRDKMFRREPIRGVSVARALSWSRFLSAASIGVTFGGSSMSSMALCV